MRISLDQSNGILRLMICRRCFGNPKFHSQEKKQGIRRCAWIFRLTLKESTSMCDDEDESIDRLDESLVSFGSMEIYGDLWNHIYGYLRIHIMGYGGFLYCFCWGTGTAPLVRKAMPKTGAPQWSVSTSCASKTTRFTGNIVTQNKDTF